MVFPLQVASGLNANLKTCEAKLALIDRLVSGEAEDLDEETTDEEIGDALKMLQGLLQLTQPNASTEVDLQSLQLPSRSAAETALARYSWAVAATVNLASQAISALPFGAPVAAVLNGLYGHAEQVRPPLLITPSLMSCHWSMHKPHKLIAHIAGCKEQQELRAAAGAGQGV